MSNIRTLEDQFQYQAHKLIQEIIKDNELENLSHDELEQWLNRHQQSVGEKFLERVDNYCGIHEAIENEY